MSIQKLPSGTRGAKGVPHLVARLVNPLMVRVHRRQGDQFQGMELLYLTTVGARSGQQRTAPVARFDDGPDSWVVVASANGAAQHPAWYLNLVAHPDQVLVEVAGRRHTVTVEQLEGEERAAAWRKVVARVPRFARYETKTDRPMPVLRLRSTGSTPTTAG
jgi:deazaflavin-dependent oxidoreductase (nitroreductase family)